MQRAHDVVVSGLGAVSGLGSGCAAHVQALREGRDGLRRTDRFDTTVFATQLAGTWPAWDGRRQDEAESAAAPVAGGTAFSPVAMAVVAAREALANARLGGAQGPRISLVLGTCFGEAFTFFHEVTEAVAWEIGARGACVTVSTACSSSTNAVGLGRDLLVSGRADVVLAGGVDVLLSEVFAGFNALRVLSADKCTPFGQSYGTTLAEGAGFVVLERRDDARRRNIESLCAISGYGLSADGHHETAPDPRGAGIERAIRWALASAQVAGHQIDHVNAHATGTESNDRTEWEAIARALQPRTDPVAVSGIKSFLGHAMGAAGVLELIMAVLAMREGFIPPTLRLSVPRPGAPPDPVPGPLPRRAHVRHALDISAAFGGANAVVVYADPEVPAPPVVPPVPGRVVVRGLGAVSPLGLGIEPLVRAVADRVPVAGCVPAFSLTSIVPTADPRGLDPSSIYLTAAAALALKDAPVALRGREREETGLFVGATRMPRDSAQKCRDSLVRSGPAGMSAAAFARMSVNAPAGTCCKHLGTKGPCTTLSIGSGSGLLAVALAADWLARRGETQRLLAGAVDEGVGRAPEATAAEGAVCVLLERTVQTPQAGEITLVGCGIAGPGDVQGAAREALGDHPRPDGVWSDSAAGRACLAPRVPDARALPLGFRDLGAVLAPGEAMLSAQVFVLAAFALRAGQARSILVLAARSLSAAVAVLLTRRD